MIDAGGVVLVIIALLILVAVVKLGAILDWIKRDRVTPLLFPDPGEKWPPDLCSHPPCDHEENWSCDFHAQRVFTTESVGRHRAVWDVPLDDQPAEVILAIVTDLKKRQLP